MTYIASSLAALGLPNLPVLSVFGIGNETESSNVDFSKISRTATAEVRKSDDLGAEKMTVVVGGRKFHRKHFPNG